MYDFLYTKRAKHIADGLVAGSAFYLAYQIRFEGHLPLQFVYQLEALLPLVIAGRLLTHTLFRLYRQVWRYTGVKDAVGVAQSCLAFSALLLSIRLGLPDRWDAWTVLRVPLGVIAADFLLVLVGSLTARLLWRTTLERQSRESLRNEKTKRVLLLGAGSGGVLTARGLMSRPHIKIVGFLDDSPSKIGSTISGIPVLGPLSQLPQFVREHEVDQAIVCIARAPQPVLRRIWSLCDSVAVQTLIIPDIDEWIDGEVRINRLRQLSLEELLGRQVDNSLEVSPELLDRYRNKRILISGAGGSIGAELARQLAGMEPELLLLLDKDENGLFELDQRFSAHTPSLRYRLLVADIRFAERMRQIFEQYKPEIVFHAAAHKHVPLMEHNPCEAVWNNVFGTRNLIEAASAAGCGVFIMISTDKAVNPSSVMGATKRLGEMMIQTMGGASQCRFACVRFGNVANSRGSVIPLFQAQIAGGGPITLTDPLVTRYFMTIPEAVHLVIHAGILNNADDGAIHVLNMGDPIRVVDLARSLIEMQGLRPGHDVRIETIGLRPGEKLSEDLVGNEESLTPSAHPRISLVRSASSLSNDRLGEVLEQLWIATHKGDDAEVLRLLAECNLGFRGAAIGIGAGGNSR